MNIIDPILYQCRRQPPAAAICVPGPGIGLISYRRLEQFINNVSRRLQAFGLPERTIIAIGISDVIFHVVVLLAATRLGLITVSLREGDVALPVKTDALIADKEHPLARMGRVILADMSWTEGDGRPLEPHLLPQTHEDDVCRLILTSGTSSTPKAVPLSHRLISARMARHAAFGNRLPACSRIYADLPIPSSLGFQFLIYTLTRGGTVFFPGPNFASTLRVIEDYRVQCLMGSPGAFENLLRWYESVAPYQSNVELMVCAGDVLSQSLSARLRGRICSHLLSIYGSTEASMTAVAYAHEIAGTARAVGFVTPGVVIQIVDASGIVLPPGNEGLVRIRSEFAVDQYLGDPEESQRVFRDGWFYPGDLGTLSAEGLLVITGRQQAMLNLGGDKVSPETIEAALSQFQGVVEAAAAAVPNAFGNNEVWALVVTNEKIDEARLRAYCEARIQRPFAPTKYVFVDNLPRNENGKLDRRRLNEMVRQSDPASS
jgi:acyl-CoA synthetase (AMP-forming)/AMP-acid ligase II